MLTSFEQRLRDLQDNIAQDLKLLKRYEDALRLEDNPTRQMRFELEIQKLRSSATFYQQEADELKSQFSKVKSPNTQSLNNKLDRISSDLRLLQGGQIAILGRLDQTRQTLLARYDTSQQATIATIVKQLNQTQISITQILLDALDTNQLSEPEIEQLWALLEKRILILPSSQAGLCEVIKDPELDAKHKLKVSVPIIPFILDYEGELELGTGFNIKNAWEKVKSRL